MERAKHSKRLVTLAFMATPVFMAFAALYCGLGLYSLNEPRCPDYGFAEQLLCKGTLGQMTTHGTEMDGRLDERGSSPRAVAVGWPWRTATCGLVDLRGARGGPGGLGRHALGCSAIVRFRPAGLPGAPRQRPEGQPPNDPQSRESGKEPAMFRAGAKRWPSARCRAPRRSIRLAARHRMRPAKSRAAPWRSDEGQSCSRL
jgi:hypothetical protein